MVTTLFFFLQRTSTALAKPPSHTPSQNEIIGPNVVYSEEYVCYRNIHNISRSKTELVWTGTCTVQTEKSQWQEKPKFLLLTPVVSGKEFWKKGNLSIAVRVLLLCLVGLPIFWTIATTLGLSAVLSLILPVQQTVTSTSLIITLKYGIIFILFIVFFFQFYVFEISLKELGYQIKI